MAGYIIYPLKETEWQAIDWGAVGKFVWYVQCKIYKYAKSGDVIKVRNMQNLLLGSPQARLLAVRKVTQDNKGKQSAGIDGLKNLKPKARLLLANSLHLSDTCLPVRRVWVPKPGKIEKRPLGIPTMLDRAKQALALLALEPEFEAKFEANSYGFRPGRNAQDAMHALRFGLKNNPKYVFEADIKGCFDNILHDFLIDSLKSNPIIQDQVRAWLKGKVVEPTGEIINPDKGTPQGGIISPLLANIALDGLETLLSDNFESHRNKPGWSKLYNQGKATFARYADDFVICHPDLSFLQECITLTEEFLAARGLTISKEKSRISVTNKRHLTTDPSFNEGFDFLGFHFKMYNLKAHGTTSRSGIKKPYVLYVTPSKNNQKEHYLEMRKTVWKNKSSTQEDLIKRLNPKIRGWAHYYVHANSSEIFSTMDHKLWWLIFSWSKKRHATKANKWVFQRYYHPFKNVKQRFCSLWHERPSLILAYYSEFHITKYTKCKADYSPYAFPSKPIKDLFSRNTLSEKLYKRQEGLCKVCGSLMLAQEPLEKHHLLPKGIKERNNIRYIWLIHTSCHDQVHATDADLPIKKVEDLLEFQQHFKS